MLRQRGDQWEQMYCHVPEEHLPETRLGRKPIPTRDPATLSSGLTRFVVRLREEPVLQRALERLTTTIKI